MLKANWMNKNKRLALINIAVTVLLLAVILAGSAFRLMNVNWDDGRHLHPDERFLSQVISFIRPVESLGDYFDTSKSSLNPANHDFGFFVYGTLPVFIIRYVGEWTGQTGYDLNTIVGRQLSAYFDILTILLVFVIGLVLYNKWVGLGGAALYAFAVLPIQQAHFMTVDSFTNTFGMLTVLAAVLILKRPVRKPSAQDVDPMDAPLGVAEDKQAARWYFGAVLRYLFFGVALGMATASKVNAVSLALLLPLVEIVRWLQSPQEEREKSFLPTLGLMLLAAVSSFIVFRIFQPYAFDGPGFFSIKINQGWWGSMRALRGQATGEVDFPPALQWTRRPFYFSVENLVLWGIGIPFALSAILGALGMFYKILKRKAYIHLPLLAWTAVYFAWQGFAWVKAMRYLLLIYPLLAIFAGWLFYELISKPKSFAIKKLRFSPKLMRGVGVAIALIAILGTAAYAGAFTRIYTRPVTRVAATDWIYENIPGPINLGMNTAEGPFRQAVGFRFNTKLEPNEHLSFPYKPADDSFLVSLKLSKVEVYTDANEVLEVELFIRETHGENLLGHPIKATINFTNVENTRAELDFVFPEPPSLKSNETYIIEIKSKHNLGTLYFSGQAKLNLSLADGTLRKELLSPITERISAERNYFSKIYITQTGSIESIYIPFALDVSQQEGIKDLKISLLPEGKDEEQASTAIIRNDFLAMGDGRGLSFEAKFDKPLVLDHPQVIDLKIELIGGDGEISLGAHAPAHESSWDDGLPTSKPGYVAYHDSGGLYLGGLNLEMYWPDDASKLERFKETLTIADYIFITSNRQWGTISRVPERYPLSTFYYRQLLGCPETLDVVSCYNIAEPEMFAGSLGFELIKTFTSYPTLGNWQFNDQFAEEAFSVYDHPKVLIFKKTEHFNASLLDQLDLVDLSKAVFLTPKQAHTYKAPIDGETSLMLDAETLDVQRSGGTWSKLFSREAWQNQNQWVAVFVFYLFVTLLGWLVFPIVHLALGGLKDKGYAFSRMIGLLLFAWIAFSFGSNGVQVTRSFLWLVVAFIAIVGILTAVLTRKKLYETLKNSWKQFIVIEAIGLLAFFFFLMVRYLNPDLWHPWKGGEKPMDFSYLNAVIKSSTFPAYDPWYAGGYINYYYYGQVIVGMPVKALGIVPAIAYNIILPLWYSLLAIATFSVTWNISKLIRKDSPEKLFGISFWAGVLGVLFVCLLGNLGEVKVIADAWMMLGSRGVALQELKGWQRLGAFFRGIAEMFKGQNLPVPRGNWYWNPSRAIPGEPITEFPYFTFLYADLHAHLIALPIVMSSIGWSVSLLGKKIQLKGAKFVQIAGLVLTFLIGGLLIGALKPSNTWDVYTFLALAACVIIYVVIRYGVGIKLPKVKEWQNRALFAIGFVLVLYVLSGLLYKPFNSHFMPGFTKVGFWTGDKTPIPSYLMHWGLPIFVILAWFSWESYQWTAKTRLSELALNPNKKKLFMAMGGLAIVVLAGLLVLKTGIALIALPICFWALLLLLSFRQSDGKRLLYFMVGTGFLLTIVVELVHLVGDIGRMNVVFKLYMQAWLLINLSAASGLAILLHKRLRWSVRRRTLLQVPLIVLLFFAMLFPILATRDKVADRMSDLAPKTLDGMKYMESSQYFLDGILMDLGQDYRAILWLQENVSGSPVILEAQAFEYYWGNRYTIYTGLPGVVGWNYHQRQQRAIWANNAVWDRVESVNQFYTSTDQNYVEAYLREHDISYIIVGQQERIRYAGEGLAKFEALNGKLWNEVYREHDTVIYQVKKDG